MAKQAIGTGSSPNDGTGDTIRDAFVNVKEACMRLQEKTKCSNNVVIEMLNNVIEFYDSQGPNKID